MFFVDFEKGALSRRDATVLSEPPKADFGGGWNFCAPSPLARETHLLFFASGRGDDSFFFISVPLPVLVSRFFPGCVSIVGKMTL
jgi:hypothetical protein